MDQVGDLDYESSGVDHETIVYNDPEEWANFIKKAEEDYNVPHGYFINPKQPFSEYPLPRRQFWHLTMHRFCPTQAAKDAVLAMLICERRVDALVEQEQTDLCSLDHEVWLLILTFVRRDQLGRDQLESI